MIKAFYEFRKTMMAGICINVFVTLFIIVMSSFVLSLGIIFKDIIGIVLGAIMAIASLVLIVFLTKDTIESVVDYKKAKKELIRILDNILEGGKYND